MITISSDKLNCLSVKYQDRDRFLNGTGPDPPDPNWGRVYVFLINGLGISSSHSIRRSSSSSGRWLLLWLLLPLTLLGGVVSPWACWALLLPLVIDVPALPVTVAGDEDGLPCPGVEEVAFPETDVKRT